MKHIPKHTFFVTTVISALALCAPAQAVSFQDWAKARAEGFVDKGIGLALINQANETKLPEIPSISADASALTEGTDVPSVISALIQAGGLNKDTKPASFTLTAYGLKAFLTGEDPQNGDYYQQSSNRLLRRFSVTVGYDDSDVKDAAGVAFQKGTLVSGKVVLLGNRELKLGNESSRNIVATQKELTKASSRLSEDVSEYLHKSFAVNNEDVGTFRVRAINSINFDQQDGLLNKLNAEQQKEVDRLIALHLALVLQKYNRVVAKAVRNLQNRPQMALSYQSKHRPNRGDDGVWLVAYDQGFGSKGARLTVNSTYGHKLDDTAVDNRGWTFSAKYQLPTKGKAESKETGGNPTDAEQPKKLSWAAEIDRTRDKPIYKSQLQYIIPLSEGIELPISITWANRAEFVNEGKVKGHIGITVDYEKIKLGDLFKNAK